MGKCVLRGWRKIAKKQRSQEIDSKGGRGPRWTVEPVKREIAHKLLKLNAHLKIKLFKMINDSTESTIVYFFLTSYL